MRRSRRPCRPRRMIAPLPNSSRCRPAPWRGSSASRVLIGESLVVRAVRCRWAGRSMEPFPSCWGPMVSVEAKRKSGENSRIRRSMSEHYLVAYGADVGTGFAPVGGAGEQSSGSRPGGLTARPIDRALLGGRMPSHRPGNALGGFFVGAPRRRPPAAAVAPKPRGSRAARTASSPRSATRLRAGAVLEHLLPEPCTSAGAVTTWNRTASGAARRGLDAVRRREVAHEAAREAVAGAGRVEHLIDRIGRQRITHALADEERHGARLQDHVMARARARSPPP